MGLRKFFNRQVNIRFIKASSAVLITALFVILLSFSVKIFNSFADTVTPVGDVLYSEVISGSTYEYYKNCIVKNGSVISSVIDQYDITDTANSSAESCMAYLYEDTKLMIFDGEGYTIPFTEGLMSDNSIMPVTKNCYNDYHTVDYSEVTKAVASNNGFKPHGSIGAFFNGFYRLEYIDMTNFDTSEVTDMSLLFYFVPVKEIKGIENLDVSKVTSFYSCFDLSYGDGGSYEKNIDLSKWNVSNATNFDKMFSGFSRNNVSVNLSGWTFNTLEQVSMYSLFDMCCLSYLDVSNWNAGNSDLYSISIFCLNSLNVLNLENSKLRLNNFDFDFENGNIETIILPKTLSAVMPYGEISLSTTMYGYDANGNLIADSEYTSLPVASGDLYKVRLSSNLTNDNCIYRTYDTVNDCVIRYFTDGIETAGVKDTTSPTVFDMSVESNGSIKAYLYSDGTLILDGNGNINTAKYYGYRNTSYSSSVKFAAISNNGFNPDTLKYIFYNLDVTKVDLGGLDTSNIKNMSHMFEYCYKLTSLDLSQFDTSNVEDMSAMFYNCKALTSITFGTNFDTSNVEDMSYMFAICQKLLSIDLSKFNTSSVTTMEYMFAECYIIKKLDLSSFDTSKVTNMNQMFFYDQNLNTLIFGPNCTATSLKEMKYMFCYVKSLQTIDLSTFESANPSSLESIYALINNSSGIKTINFGKLDFSNLVSSEDISYYTSINEIVLPRGVSETANIKLPKFGDLYTWMGYDIEGNRLLDTYTNLPAYNDANNNGFEKGELYKIKKTDSFIVYTNTKGTSDTSDDVKYYIDGIQTGYNTKVRENVKVIDLSYNHDKTFVGFLYSDGTLVLSGNGKPADFQTNKILASYNSSIKNIVIEDAGISFTEPVSLAYIFSGLSNTTSIDLTRMNTAQVTSMEAMFADCSSLRSITFGDTFDTSNVQSMASMFETCMKVESLDLSNFNTSNVTNMSAMFFACQAIKTLDLSSFESNIEKFNKAEDMFYGCDELETLNLGDLDFSNVSSCFSLDGNTKLQEIILPKGVSTSWDIRLPSVDGAWYGFDKEGTQLASSYVNLPQYIDGGDDKFDDGELYEVKVALPPPLYTRIDDNGTPDNTSDDITYKYYVGGYTVNDGEKITTDYYAFDISSSGSAGTPMAYLYGDGMVVLDGEGYVNEYYDSYYKHTTHRDNVNKAATSVNGFKPSSCKFLFQGLRNLESVDLATLDCTNVSSYEQMFNGCTKLKSVSFPDSQSTKITSLYCMFNGCTKLESVNLQNLNETTVDYAIQMFNGCESLKNITFPAVKFDTTNPQMTWMFGNCESLDSVIFAEGIDTTAITNVAMMFNGCKKLKSIDLSSWKFDNVTDGNDLFYNANAIEKVILPESVPTTGDIPLPSSAKWVIYDKDDNVINSDPTKVVSYTTKGDYISNVVLLYTYTDPDSGKVTKYYTNGHKVNNGELVPCKASSSLNGANNKLMYYLYQDGMLVLSGKGSRNTCGDTAEFRDDAYRNSITKVASANSGCIFESGSTARVLFKNLTNLQYADLQTMDISNVVATSYMFDGCSNLKTLLLGENFKIDNAKSAYYMFKKCSSLEKLDLSIFTKTASTTSDNSGYISFCGMFAHCTSLTELNLENLVTVPNTDFDYMFGETSETGLQYPPLTKLNIKSMDLSGVRSSSHAFTLVGDGTKQMNELNEIVLPTKVSSTYNIALPTHEGYVWMGYLEETQVSSKTYTYLPAREGGVVDTIRLVEEPPIYTDDLGTTDTSDDIKYYKSRTNKTSGTDKIDFIKEYDISKETDGSLMAYLYSNGMLILDGTGNLFETNYSASTKVLMPYASDTANKSKITKVAFSDLGFTPDTCKGLFATLNNLSSIYNISKLNATSVTDYSYMFSDCTSLTNVDLSSLNFNNITDMSYMFSNCTSMVKNITWPSCVFANDVNMGHLFDGCSLLEEVDLSTFNMSNVTDDNHVIDVFKGCTKINKIILPIATRRYDQTGVIDLPDPLHFNKYEANGTKYDDHVYLEILGRTNEGDYLGKDKNTLLFTDTKGTPETTDDDVKYYLYGDEGTGILVDSVKEFCLDGNTVAIHYNDGMLILQGEGNINAGDYNCIVPSTSIMNSFKANTTKAACSNLRFIPDSLGKLFYGYDELESFDATNLDCTNVKSYQQMFDGCTLLKSAIFPNSQSTNKTKIYAMFNECKALENVDLKNLNGTTVTDAQEMFYNCDKLTSITFPSVTFGNDGTNARLSQAFNSCDLLESVTFADGINTEYVTDIRFMCDNCPKLEYVDFSNCDFSGLTTKYEIFRNSTAIEKVILPSAVPSSSSYDIPLPSSATWVVFKADGTIRDTTPKTKLLACTETGDYISKGIPISSCTFTAPTNLVYDGNAQTFTLDIKNGSTPLVLDTDYEIVEWGNNTNAGLSTDTNAPYVKVKGKGTYVGEATYKFDIAKYDLEVDLNDATSNAVLNVTDTKTYDGDNKAKLSGSDTFSINYPTGVIVSSNEQTIKINLKGTFDSKDVDATKVTYEITSLSDGDNGGLISNYNVTYKDNVSVNDNKFERVGTITPFEITMSWPTSLQVSKSYDGDNKVKFDDGSGNLTETKPHSFTGVNSETVHVLISGTYTSGSASGSDLSYTLRAMLDTSDTYKAVNKNYVLSDISKTKNGNDGVISALSFNDGTRFNITNNFVTPIEYDGQIHKVSISDFAITLDGTELDNISDDFEIVFDSDSYNYIDAGTYNYKLKAKETGKYSGEIPFSYTITPKVINVTDIVLEPYSSTNLLTKEYDGNKDFVIKEGMITPSLKYHFNDDVTLTLNYSKGEYSDSNKDNTIAIKASNGGNASTKDLVFSTITLDSSSNTGINLNNFVLNSSDDFSSITFSNCGQILDTISPVITDVSFDKTTIGKNGTLEITLTFSEDLVHDFSSIDNEELNNKFYIELNSLLGVTPSVNYGKAYIDLVKMESCDANKLIFKYLLPSEYNDGYLVEGLSGAIHKDNINVSDDCDNQIDTAFSSDLQTNKFGTLVINTQGIVVNIKAYSDSTYDESKLLDTSKNTDLLTIYYEFIFEDSVNDFDESDIKVKINGMDKEITSGLTKVDNKVYRIAISNAGYLSVDDTDGIISMIVSLEKGCAHDANGNDTISQSLALNVERNLIIKDETVLQDIPGVTNKVFAKVADYTSKLSYKVFKYFDSLMQESDEVKESDGLLITTHEVTNNGIKLVLDVTAKLNEYKTKVTQFSYVVKTNDHIAKEIINNVIPTSDSTKDGNIKNIILDPDNEEILKLDSDVKTIINNPSNTDVHDAIVEALKDLIEKENVHGLNDSEKIKDKLKDVISDIARLVDPSNTYGLNFIIDESKNPEERMICYQKLTAIQKEYLDKHYRIDIDKLYIAYKDYVTFSDTKENETIEKFDDTEEIEIYGVIDRIDNTLTEDDIRTLSVEKIKDEDRLTNINTTLENEGKLTGKKVIIPYDIKLLVNGTPVTDNTYQNMLIKLSLPKEFYNAVFEIYHLSDDNTFGEQIEIHKQIYNNECLIFFEANSFSPYIPVSNLRTVLVRTNDDALGTVSPKGLSAVDVGTNKNITITPNQGYYANVLENGVKVKEKFRGTYTLNDIQDNKEIYVEFIKDEEPEKPTEPEKPSITNATVITIQTANHMPYINGYSDKTFRPNNAMTRAEFTKVISTISNNFNLSYDNDKYITKYKDVKEDSWYSNYVGYVTKLGLMKGYNDGTFKPNNYITRAEVSKVLSDMFNVPDKQIENIFFNELNGHWYFNSTNELIKGGVIKGYKDGTFKPNKNVTRAEVISLINRVKDREIDKDIDKGYLNMMDSKFKDVSKSNWFYNDLLEASIAHNSFDLH